MAGELSQCVLTLSAAVVLRKDKTIKEGGITIDFYQSPYDEVSDLLFNAFALC